MSIFLTKMYTLTFIYRMKSGGFRYTLTRTFNTINEVSKYLQETWYEQQFESEHWDSDDKGCEQPTRNDFSVTSLETRLGNTTQVELYGPYSQFLAVVPDQVILSSDTK